MTEWMALALKVAISGWMIGIAAWDHWRRRVPTWLVLPVMLAALAYQVYLFVVDTPGSNLVLALVAWVMLFVMWQAHFFGGGDAKFLMALFALFPETRFLAFFATFPLSVSALLLLYQLWRGRHRGPGQEGLAGEESLPPGMRGLWRNGRLLPTAQGLTTSGRPHCWTFALPGVIFLWWIR